MLFGQFLAEPFVETVQASRFFHRIEVVAAVHVANVFDLVEAAEGQRLVSIDRRSNVFTVITIFHLLLQQISAKKSIFFPGKCYI